MSLWASIAFLASPVLSIETLPFTAAADVATSKKAFEILQLLRRANNCPAGFNPCTELGDSNACCQSGTICTRDAANQIACCPTGASCTGTLSATPASTTSSFVFIQSGTNGATTTGPTLTGAAYPFVVIPTTFSDAAGCSSYYFLCESEYTSCTSALVGRYGVTVAGGGAGTTVAGLSPAAAASTCSSLSMDACHGLQIGYCAAYPTGGSAPSRATRHHTSFRDLVLGAAVGFAGLFV